MDAEAFFNCPDSVEDKGLYFRSLKMREALGRLPEYHLELVRDMPPGKEVLKPQQLLGKSTSVDIKLTNTEVRHLHGVITHFERGGTTGNFDIYRIVMRPWLWQLTLGADCRVFQDKSVLEILDHIFAEYRSANDVDKSRLSPGSVNTRPYTVQYNESDFNFVSRLMEEEGIYYYFTHAKSKHTLVLCNSAGAHKPFSAGSLFWYERQKDAGKRSDTIIQWSSSHTLQSLKYTHTDYAAEAPTTDLEATADRSPKPPYDMLGDLEVFRYPGGHDDLAMAGAGGKAADGKTLARHEIDRFESEHAIATGLTKHRNLAVGSIFSFEEHPDAGDYLVTESVTEMEYAGYEASFDARSPSYLCRFNGVPHRITFKPQAVAERAIVHGPQTATVTGPDGDEIYTDRYGRVKVRFHWDRLAKKNKLLEKSSCWVRVAHPWAGKGFGMVALPRVGDEVIVEFLEGNPDRPMITGRVYNGVNGPPYELPRHATVSGIRTHSSKGGGTDNFNELRFEDEKGKEYVWLQAEKDFRQLVKNDAFASVKNDLWTDVTRNTQHKIGENLTMSVGKVATLAVAADTHAKLGADLNTAVGGKLNVQSTGAVALKGDRAIAMTSGATMDLNAGAGLNLTAASFVNMKGVKIVLDAGMELCIKAGSSFITLNASGVTIQGAVVKINSGGAAGPAKEAAKASPTVPREPGEATQNKDPMAEG